MKCVQCLFSTMQPQTIGPLLPCRLLCARVLNKLKEASLWEWRGLAQGASESTEMGSVPTSLSWTPSYIWLCWIDTCSFISQASIYLWCCLGLASVGTTSKYRRASRLNLLSLAVVQLARALIFFIWFIVAVSARLNCAVSECPAQNYSAYVWIQQPWAASRW